MANRLNHYEAAFEAYLRSQRIPYVAVDEARRAPLADETVKSVDFIVSHPSGRSWLVDVKGRRFPSGRKRQYWKNWSTRDDLRSLATWRRLFGAEFSAMLVFAYIVAGDRAPLAEEQMFSFRDRLYGFVAVDVDHYAEHARQISPRWDTVAMPTSLFREFAEPIGSFF
jgi:hypothetical protein